MEIILTIKDSKHKVAVTLLS